MTDWPDFDLYKRESWKFPHGGAEVERAEFVTHAARVREVQVHLAAKSGAAPARVFHAKSHGCLLGELRLLSEREADVRYGLFGDAAPEKYPVLARFSNGQGTIQHDYAPDVRGVAIKIFNAGPKREHSVDFLMTNSRVAFGKDHAEFVEFMEATADGLPGPTFVLGHTRVVASLMKAIWPPRSVSELTFGSGHPYLLGKDRAMKLKLTPDGAVPRSSANLFQRLADRDYLRHELAGRAATAGLRYKLFIQLEYDGDPTLTPIENALSEWDETASPPLPVAELVFPPQEVTEAQHCYVENLPFNPWNYHPEHRPLGNLARGRLFSYAASREGRAAIPEISYESFLAEWNRLGVNRTM
jgi:hypothetical protein